MDVRLSSAASARVSSSWPSAIDKAAVLVVAALLLNAALAAFGLLLIIRRAAGALERPAPAALLTGAVLTLGLIAWFSRRLSRSTLHAAGAGLGPRRLTAVIAWAPSVAIVLLTIGLSWPFGRLLDWLVCAPLWIADTLGRKAFLSAVPPRSDQAVKRGLPASPEADHPSRATQGVRRTSGTEGEVVLQQLTRMRNPHGRESVVGSLHAEIVPGQRTGEVYVGFCPPFETLPSVEVEQSGGPAARLSVGQILAHGARVDIRLNEAATIACNVVIELYVSG